MFMNYNDRENPNEMTFKAYFMPLAVYLIGLIISLICGYISEILGIIALMITIFCVLFTSIMYLISIWNGLEYKGRSKWWFILILFTSFIGLIIFLILKNYNEKPPMTLQEVNAQYINNYVC